MEKLIASKMLLAGSNRRIHSVHRHAGLVCEHFIFYSFNLALHSLFDSEFLYVLLRSPGYDIFLLGFSLSRYVDG